MSKVELHRPKTGGRQRGTPNRVTADVREAIAQFARNNVDQLQVWLERIAADDPAKAADLFVRLLEYHIPKLARSEVSLHAPVRRVQELSTRELLESIAAAEDTETDALVAIPSPLF